MKNIRIRLVVLLILQTLWLETSYAADAGDPKFKEEFSKQERYFKSGEERAPEGYTIDRTLLDYTQLLSSEFTRALANLGPTDRWLDIGAGTGQAMLDYYSPAYDLRHAEGRERRGKKARAVAMSIEDRRTPVWLQTAARLGADQLQYLFDRRLREYSLKELGHFQVITDVIGGFSYSEDLSLFVEKVLGFLELNSSFYTVLQDVHSEDGSNLPHYANSPYLTEIVNADGSKVKVCSWLKSIACVQVACELRTPWKPPVEVYNIRKVCNDVTVPPLSLIHYQAGTPPERRYQLKH